MVHLAKLDILQWDLKLFLQRLKNTKNGLVQIIEFLFFLKKKYKAA